MDPYYGSNKNIVSSPCMMRKSIADGANYIDFFNSLMSIAYNKVCKASVVVMVVSTSVFSSLVGAQRDVSSDDLKGSLDSIQESIIEQPIQEQFQGDENDKQPIRQVMIPRTSKTNNQSVTTNYKSIIAAGSMSNKIDPHQLYSYAKGGGRGSILCSTIARINLSLLTGLPYSNAGFKTGTIARGDAYALALRAADRDQVIVTDRSSMADDIWEQYEQTHNTIYDVYFYKASNGGVMQGHRAVVFIGTDNEIYILDPIRGLATAKPQTLAQHFAADSYKGYTMYISKLSYAPRDSYKTIKEYYEISDNHLLVDMVRDGIVTDESIPLATDIVLKVHHPIKIRTDYEEVTIETGSVITIERASTLVGWKFKVQEGKFKAQFVRPQLAMVMTSWDR